MVKNDNGYSFQPGLMDKMYQDKKEEKEKAEKEKNKEKRKASREKKRKEKEKERKKKQKEIESKKKKKDKEWTYKDKVNYSILAIVMVPLFQLFFIYHQGSWLDIVLQSTKNSNYLKQWLPDGDGLPYSKGEQGSGIKCKEIKKYLPAREKAGGEASSASSPPPQAGGGKKRRRRVQKGGFSSGLNDAKEFFDSTKYGIPYEWADNDNFLMSGIGEYFKTFWQGNRTALKFLQEQTNDAFFKDHKEPNGLGEKAWDFIKFAAILPVVNIVAYIGQIVTNLVLLFWASFNNQTIMILPFFILAICSIFLGAFTGYFWPWGLFTLYLTVFNLRPNAQKISNFQTYGKRYKWLWCISILVWWFVIIGGGIWKWHKDAMIFLGIIAALFFLGMIGISTLV